MYEVALFANALLWLVLVAVYLRLPAFSIFHPASYYLFFHGFVFVFRPIVVHLNGYTSIYQSYDFMPDPDDKLTVILGAMLGLICFVGAAIRAGNVPFRFAHDRFTQLERAELTKPFLLVCTFLVPPALLSTFARWSARANDSTTMLLDPATGRYINTDGIGYLADFQIVLAPLAVMFVWFFRFRWWSFLPLVAFIVLRGGTGGRWPIVMACAAVALLMLYQARRRLPDLKAGALLAAALVLFQAVGFDRGATIRQVFTEEQNPMWADRNAGEPGFLESMDFANLEYFEFIVHAVPDKTGTYGYFLDNLQLFTEPVPRKFWPGKPIGPPIQRFNLFDHGYPIGMTYSLPGAGWMQFGYAGIAMWCGLFGWLYGKAYSRFVRSRQSTLRTLAFMLALPISLQVFRDGTLLTLAKTHAWFLFPVVLIHALAWLSATPMADDLRRRAVRLALHRQSGRQTSG